MEISGHLLLLRLVTSIVAIEEQHCYEEEIKASVMKFASLLPYDKRKPALDSLWEGICMKDTSFTPTRRLLTYNKILAMLLSSMDESAVREFFGSRLKKFRTS